MIWTACVSSVLLCCALCAQTLCVALRAGHSSYNALQATVLFGLALLYSLEQIMVQMNASE